MRGKWGSPTSFAQTALSRHPCLAKQPPAGLTVVTAQPRSDLFAVFARATLSGEDFSDAILLVSALRAALLTDAKMVLVTRL